MRGRPRHDGPVGLHVDFDGGARNNPGIGGSGALLLLVRGGSCSERAMDVFGYHTLTCEDGCCKK